jgi:hypothetical protein
MKLRKSSMCLVGFAVLVLSCFIASAASITDGTNDVWHWTQSGTAWSWSGNVGDKPNIDITEVSYTVNENKLTLTLEVKGTIQNSEKISYFVFYNSTDTQYFLSYTNGSGGGWGMKTGNFTSGQNITVSEGKISVELNVLGDTSKVDLWGYAVEYTTLGSQTTNEWWGDWAPNQKFTYDTGTPGDIVTPGNDSSPPEKKTPGFEVVPVIAAVAIALMLLRRRR